MLIPTVYILASVMRIQAATFAVAQGARDAGRVMDSAPSVAVGVARAEEIARLALTDQRVSADGMTAAVRAGRQRLRVGAGDPAQPEPGDVYDICVVAVVTFPGVPTVVTGTPEHRDRRLHPARRRLPGGRLMIGAARPVPALAVGRAGVAGAACDQSDRGSVTPLVIGMMVCLLVLTAGVTAAGSAFLAGQRLQRLCDGAVAAAVGAVNPTRSSAEGVSVVRPDRRGQRVPAGARAGRRRGRQPRRRHRHRAVQQRGARSPSVRCSATRRCPAP